MGQIGYTDYRPKDRGIALLNGSLDFARRYDDGAWSAHMKSGAVEPGENCSKMVEAGNLVPVEQALEVPEEGIPIHPTREAFLTGSRVYGQPREDSDYDLVAYMDIGDAAKLIAAADSSSSAEYAQQITLRFGKLNLIVCTQPEYYDAWQFATNCAVEEQFAGDADPLMGNPVSKERAKELFRKVFDDRDLEQVDKPARPTRLEDIPPYGVGLHENINLMTTIGLENMRVEYDVHLVFGKGNSIWEVCILVNNEQKHVGWTDTGILKAWINRSDWKRNIESRRSFIVPKYTEAEFRNAQFMGGVGDQEWD